MNSQDQPSTLKDWKIVRKKMLLDSEVANLNTGSFGPLPRVVFERATALRRRLAEEPMDFLVRTAPELLWESRVDLANYLGCNPVNLLFTANVSASINMVASSLRPAAPGEILMSDREYGTMQWCWERSAQRQGLTVRTFPLPLTPTEPQLIVDLIRDAIGPQTRLLFFSHIYSANGLVMPAQAICRMAKSCGVTTVVDGAHAPGMIPLNIPDIGCDFYGGNCHKWMLAPTGAGFLWFDKTHATALRPQHVSWGWRYDPSQADQRNPFGATNRLFRLEFEGTRDPCAWLSVPEAIRFQSGIGTSAIRTRNEKLSTLVRRRIVDELGWPAATPQHDKLKGWMTSFRLPVDCDPAKLREHLWTRKIEAPVNELFDGALLRVSTHFYNTEDEISRLVEALQEFA